MPYNVYIEFRQILQLYVDARNKNLTLLHFLLDIITIIKVTHSKCPITVNLKLLEFYKSEIISILLQYDLGNVWQETT